jgi:hypothetical protein
MSPVMALKLARRCPHCGEELLVVFKSDLKGDLQAAVVHGMYEALDYGHVDWKPVKGLNDMVKLPEPEVPW